MKRSALQHLLNKIRHRRTRPRAAILTEVLETRCLLSGVSAETHVDDHDHAIGDECWIPEPEFVVAESTNPVAVPPFPISQTFNLSSLPGANHTIYLDFDGHTTSGTQWNTVYNGDADIITPAYDTDGDDTTFSTAEHEAMQRAWQRMAEDFAPFNVNVTTIEPPLSDLIKVDMADTRWGVRVVIGGDAGGAGDWYPNSAGGVAYVGSFNDSIDTPTFVFGEGYSAKSVAEAGSHEVGHTLGLTHDGDSGQGYYPGHGFGVTGWAPIMGVGYTQNLTQWSRGEYSDANNTQDDLNIITTQNGFGYRADDHGDTTGTATNIFGTISSGIIEQNTDVDVFRFTSVSGYVTIDPFVEGPNLDILATLYNSSGTPIATSNPFSSLNAVFTGLNIGDTYYVSVEGTGKPTVLGTGYSDYGSLGQYTIDFGSGGTDPDDQIFEATPVGNGKYSDTISSGQDVDMYEIFVSGPGDVVSFAVNTPASNLDPAVTLFDANGNFIATDDDSGPGLDSLLNYTFSTPGFYYVAVHYFANSSFDPILGTGDTGTTTPGSYDLVIGGLGIAATDIGTDIIGRDGGNWWVAQSNGSNAFSTQYFGQWNQATGLLNVFSADVDADGDDDIIARNGNGQWYVGINTGASFNFQLWGFWNDLQWRDVQIADVNGDGRADIVGRSNVGNWWVSVSNGFDGFTTSLWGGWTESAGWNNVMVADLNGDGRDDIIGQANNGQWWAARSTGSSFTTQYWGYWVDLGWQDVQVADVDNDGDDDVVGRSSSGNWWVARSNGSNQFANEQWGGWVESAGWDNVMVTDLDGDGNEDIIGQATNGQWWAARSNGSSFTTEYWGYWLNLGWQDVNVIDVNADGNADVVGRSSTGDLWVGVSNGSNQFTNELWGSWAVVNWQNVMVANSGGGPSPGATFVDFSDDDEEASIFG